MSEIRFTKDHEWIRLKDDVAVVGITVHAQEALGDIVFVELPEPGKEVSEGETCATVESVKAASDVFAPLAGTVIESNPLLADDPALVNRDAGGEGWFFKLRVADKAALATLMDEAAYAKFVETV
jgi:glycine cleavage system H protein